MNRSLTIPSLKGFIIKINEIYKDANCSKYYEREVSLLSQLDLIIGNNKTKIMLATCL